MRKRLKPAYDRDESGNTLDYNGHVFVAGRPPIALNEEEVERLAMEGCPLEAIGGYLGVSDKTIANKYGAAWSRGRAWLKHQIGKAQFEAAINGNPVMLKHLGKHMLNQDEKLKVEFDKHNPAMELPLDALEAEFKRLDDDGEEE